jgi:CRP/FNR family cyclic AMP-dependent transcriptional regulator
MTTKRVSHFNPIAFFSQTGKGSALLHLKKNGVLYTQGETADSVFYLQEGKIKLSVVSENGKTAIVGILHPKAFFGEQCLAGQTTRMATATALETSAIGHIKKATMVGMLHSDPAFSALFTTYLLSNNLRIAEDLVDQLFNSCEKRLARVLLLSAQFGQAGKPHTVIAMIPQQTLAEMIGTTRSRVSFFLNKFRKLGFIEYKKKSEMRVHSSLLKVVLRDTEVSEEKPKTRRDV